MCHSTSECMSAWQPLRLIFCSESVLKLNLHNMHDYCNFESLVFIIVNDARVYMLLVTLWLMQEWEVCVHWGIFSTWAESPGLPFVVKRFNNMPCLWWLPELEKSFTKSYMMSCFVWGSGQQTAPSVASCLLLRPYIAALNYAKNIYNFISRW